MGEVGYYMVWTRLNFNTNALQKKLHTINIYTVYIPIPGINMKTAYLNQLIGSSAVDTC